jgi:phosphate transport system permease protein
MRLGLNRRRLTTLTEPIVEWAIRICGWSAILFVFAIFFFVLREGVPVLVGTLDIKEFFTSVNWRPDSTIRPQFGILALLAGTASVTALAMIISVPTGFAAAIFLSEFCGRRTREVLKIVIEFLAAIPSVVWGFIGYMVLNPLIIRATGAPIGVNVLNGAVILAFMSVPIIMSMGEDALKAVPDAHREAALALGASRWQLIYRVLLPAAKNGLLGVVVKHVVH